MTRQDISGKGWTKGPWLTSRTNEGEGYVLSVRHQAGGTQHAVAAVWDDNGMAIGEGIANARLIAAAPALYEALELALEYWGHRQQRYKNRHPVWVVKARAALSLAHGEQP